MYSYGPPETYLVFTAGITGTLNFYISAYDMMGYNDVTMSLYVNSALVAQAFSGTTSVSGAVSVAAGQTVALAYVGSSMAYSSFQLWMS